HVHPTLTALAKLGIRMAVVSDAPKLQVWMRIMALSIWHYFDTVVTIDDTGERKPSPKPFKLALERLGVGASETIMIGDWVDRDIVGAKGVGITAVFARYGDEFNTPAETIADYEVQDIAELVDIVNRLNTPAVKN
ncbi:MAG: HAD family hydrolase, partial [Elusimicrobiota bacterium]